MTVLTPTYNRANLLPRAVDSVLTQTFANFEYIVVSDGSTDETDKVMQNYVMKDKRVRYVKLPHRGLAETWETLFALVPKNSRGHLVAWLSDDDEWDATYLERMVRALDANPAAVVAYSDYRNRIDGELVPSVEPRRCGLNWEYLKYGCFISLDFAVIRSWFLTDVKRKLGSYLDPVAGAACGDWSLFLNLFPLGPFVHVHEELGTIRLHRGQQSVLLSVFELARRRYLMRRKYTRVPMPVALREAIVIMVWGTFNRLRGRLSRRR